jgi:hypothetical protein
MRMEETLTLAAPRTTLSWNPDWIGARTSPFDLVCIQTLADRNRLEIRSIGGRHWIAASEESFRHHGCPLWFGDRVKHLCGRYQGAEVVLERFRRISRLAATPLGPDSPYGAHFDEGFASRLPDSASELRARRDELASLLVFLDDQVRYIANDYIDLVGALLLLDPPRYLDPPLTNPHPLQSHLQVWRQMGLGNHDPFGDALGPYLDRIPDPAARRALEKGIRVAHHRLREHNAEFEVPRKVGLYLGIARKLESVIGDGSPVPPMSDLSGKDLTPSDRELLGALDSPAELEKIVYRAGETWKARAAKLAELCKRTGRKPPYKNGASLSSAMSRASGKKKKRR